MSSHCHPAKIQGATSRPESFQSPAKSIFPRFFACSLALLAWVSGGSAAEPSSSEPIPIKDFFRPAFINLPLVNDAGNRFIAIYGTEQDQTGALYFDLEKRTTRRLHPPAGFDIDEAHWLGNQHFMWIQSQDKLYADAIYVTAVDDFDHAFAIERKNAVEFIGAPQKTPLRPVVWIRRDAYKEGDDYGVVQLDATAKVDLDRTHRWRATTITDMNDTAVTKYGTEASVYRQYTEQKLGRTLNYLCDRNGELAFAIALVDGYEKLLVLKNDKWRLSPIDFDTHDMLAAGDEDDEIIVVGPRQDGKPRALLRMDALSGATKGVFHQDEAYDPVVASIKRHPVTRRITGLQLYRKALESVWFDPAFQTLQQTVNKLFPGRLVSILSTDTAVQRLTLAVYSDRQPVSYHLLDLAKNELTTIAESAPWISSTRMRPMQNVTFKNREGQRVEGFLTLPAGADKDHPVPLVVLAHGGPWARDSWEWQPGVQFLASRGYAVFQPNYRGSLGYAWRFPRGSNWDFRKMHDDVTDGVRQILKSGLIDPQRVALMGASFGGYLALSGAAYEPDLYRCVITESGVFDWNLMMQSARRNRFDSVRYEIYLRQLGDPKENAAAFAEMSPLNRIADIKVPVFVAHGRKDTVVDIAQSKALAAELKRHGIPHEVLFKSDEGHGLYQLDNTIEFYGAVEKFLAEHFRVPRPGGNPN